MVRRRKFLTFFKINNLWNLKNNVIRDTLYFNDNLFKISFNKRFFWKKIKHLNKYFNYFLFINNFSKFYKIIKISINNYFYIFSNNINYSYIFKINSYNFNIIKKMIILINKKSNSSIITKNTLIDCAPTLIYFNYIKNLINLRTTLLLLIFNTIYFVFRKKNNF